MSKVAIVTGASRGIGYEISKKLAESEYQTVAIARSTGLLKQLESQSPYLHAIPADLTDEQQVENLITEVKEKFSHVDILINNAGTLINKPFKELTLGDWRSLLESNLISAVNITKHLIPLFNTHAHIVNISSMGGFQGSEKFPGLAAYSAAKGALSIVTESLAVELASDKVKANALCLGAVETEMFKEAFPGFEAPVNAEEMGTYIADFARSGHRYYNGKILPVALDDPE